MYKIKSHSQQHLTLAMKSFNLSFCCLIAQKKQQVLICLTNRTYIVTAVPVKTDETHRANLNAREALWAEHNHVALLAELQKESNLLSKFDMPQHNDLNR